MLNPLYSRARLGKPPAGAPPTKMAAAAAAQICRSPTGGARRRRSVDKGDALAAELPGKEVAGEEWSREGGGEDGEEHATASRSERAVR